MSFLATVKRVAKVGLIFVEKHSPEILLTVGVTGTVAAGVIACRRTVKAVEILDEHSSTVDEIAEWTTTDEERVVALRKENRSTAVALAKCYALPVTMTVGSIAMIFSGFGIIRRRYAASIAAYNALQTCYTQYRKRIKEKYGAEADDYGLYGVEHKQITVKDDETGEKTKQDQMFRRENSDGLFSPYARIFAKYDWEHHTGSKYWENDIVYNENMLAIIESGFVTRYEAGEPIFLNEVYKALGFDILTGNDAGQRMGWWKGHEPEGSDGYFDLRLQRVINKPDPGYGDESEEVVWIVDPNVPGCVV